MSISGIVDGVVANLIFVVFTIITGWTLFNLTERRKLLSFFGIGKSRKILIYLSKLKIKLFGSVGVDGRERSFEGTAIAYGEMTEAMRFRDLFNFLLPSISEKPNILSRILISDVNIQLLPSPDVSSQIEGSLPIVTIGSNAYNSISDYAENSQLSKIKFVLIENSVSDSDGSHQNRDWRNNLSAPLGDFGNFISPSGISTAGTAILPSYGYGPSGPTVNYYSSSGSSASYNNGNSGVQGQSQSNIAAIDLGDGIILKETYYGVVQRIIEKENNRFIFYCAGLSEFSTAGSVYYLINHWHQLYKKYKDNYNFLIVMRFESSNFSNNSIVLEKSWL